MHRFLALFLLALASNAATYVTGQTLGTYRLGFDGWAGIRFHQLQTVTTTQLGLWCDSSDTSPHALKLWIDASQTPVEIASVSIACTGTTGYKYQNATVTLTKGSTYILAALQVNGVAGFYNDDTTIATTAVAAIDGSIWFAGEWIMAIRPNPRNTAFGPVNFQYTAPAPLTGINF